MEAYILNILSLSVNFEKPIKFQFSLQIVHIFFFFENRLVQQMNQ